MAAKRALGIKYDLVKQHNFQHAIYASTQKNGICDIARQTWKWIDIVRHRTNMEGHWTNLEGHLVKMTDIGQTWTDIGQKWTDIGRTKYKDEQEQT